MDNNRSLPNSFYNTFIPGQARFTSNNEIPRVPPIITPGQARFTSNNEIPRVPPINSNQFGMEPPELTSTLPSNNNIFSSPSSSFSFQPINSISNSQQFQDQSDVFESPTKSRHLAGTLSWKKRRRPGASNLPRKIFINEEKMAARLKNMSIQCEAKKPPWKCSSHEEARRIIAEIDSRLDSSESDEEIPEVTMNDGEENPFIVKLDPELKRKLQDSIFLGKNAIIDAIKPPCMELVLYKPPGTVIKEAVAEKIGKDGPKQPENKERQPVFDYGRVNMTSTRLDSGLDEDIFEDQLVFDEDEMDF